MDILNINQTCGEQRIIIGQCRTLSIEERKKLNVSFYNPSWRDNKNFLNAKEEMQYIINNIYSKKPNSFKTLFLEFVDVGIANGYECGRGNVIQANHGRGKIISMINYTSGHALSCCFKGKTNITFYFSNQYEDICVPRNTSKLKRFYSPKSLNKFLITMEK